MSIVQRVDLTVSLQCVKCMREIKLTRREDAHSVRTGNHTQRAAYMLEQMTAEVIGRSRQLLWLPLPDGEYRCGRCNLAEAERALDEAEN